MRTFEAWIKATPRWACAAAALAVGGLATANPESLDAQFANGGTLSLQIGGTYGSIASAVAIQPDGKIVTAGRCGSNLLGDFCLARFAPGGSLDASFASNGKISTRIGAGNNLASSVLLQPDGKILVGGSCDIGPKSGFCLARYTAAGSLDPTFGSGSGYVIEIVSGDYNGINAMALQPDGKVIAVGACYSNSNADDFCAARFAPSGALDSNFGVNGKTLIEPGTGFQTAYAVAVQSDGKIVVGGGCGVPPSGNSAFCAVRLDANGTVDQTYNGGLATSVISNGSHRITSLAVLPTGAVAAGGSCYDMTSSQINFCVARYTATGQLDANFGPGVGAVTTPYFGYSSEGASLVVQPDGKLLLIGYCMQGAVSLFCVTRYRIDGSPDSSFAGGGSMLFSFGSNSDRAFGAALQRDGKIVLAGACNADTSAPSLCLARLIGGPNAYAGCSADIDGDGVASTRTDSALLARAALGLKGDALTQGLTFASYATRTTSTSIRDFLFDQCGMKIAP